MQKIEIISLLSESERVMELLQNRGAVELCDSPSEGMEKLDTDASVAQLEKSSAAIEQALETLSKYVPRKTSLLDSFKGKRKVSASVAAEKTARLEKYVQIAYEITRLDREIKKCEDSLDRLAVRKDRLRPWEGLEEGFGWKGTETVGGMAGYFSGKFDPGNPALPEKCDIRVISSFNDHVNVFVLYLKSERRQIAAQLSEAGFTELRDMEEGVPSELIRSIDAEISKNKKKIADNIKKLKGYSDSCDDLELMLDYLGARAEKYRALPNLALSDSAVVITGYVPEKYSGALVKELESRDGVVASLSEPAPDEDVPVLLENSRFSEPLEGITRMYAMPSKNDPDPTPVMSFFYYLLFGMMLSDAGYGILMILGTTFALKKFVLSPSMNKSMRMFRNCGVSTVFWGALFGSWFGDAVQVIAREFFGVQIGSIALWFEPIDDPIRLLLWSFAIGILHLFWGLWAHFMNLWRHGKKLDAVLEVIPVYILIIGICPFGAGIFVQGVDQRLVNAGLIMALVGVVGVFFGAAVKRKNVFMGIVGGLYALYNTATGYVGDILSYSRLLALGLATGSIASVINMLGVMPDGVIVKLLVFIPVFIVGHVANLAINLLGAYVHTDRLQFVELFSKFYEGGGREFEPFRKESKYTQITEDN